MKKIIKIAEEIIPLSRQQVFFGIIIVSCFFQFALFYSPVLAQQAIENKGGHEYLEKEVIITMSLTKSENSHETEVSLIRETTVAAKINFETNDKQEIFNNNLKEDLDRNIDNLLLLEENLVDGEKKIALLTKPEEKDLSPEIRVIRTSFHTLTAYNSEVAQTDDTPCITANGFDVCAHGIEDTIAANFLKFGTKVRIPELFGDRIFVVRDRMNRRYPDRVDVWMLNKSDAIKFGVRRATIEVIEIIEPEVKENHKQTLISKL